MKLSFSWSPLNFIEISANSNLCSWSSSSTSSLKLVFIFQPAIVAEYNKYDSKIVMRLTIKLSYFFRFEFLTKQAFVATSCDIPCTCEDRTTLSIALSVLISDGNSGMLFGYV